MAEVQVMRNCVSPSYSIPLAFSLLFEQVVTSAVLYQTLTVGSTSEDF